MMAKNEIGVVIIDLWIQGENGVELLGKIKNLYPETTRMLLTGNADIVSIVNAINKGAIYKIVMKPWDDRDLIAAIRDAFSQYVAFKEYTAAAAATASPT